MRMTSARFLFKFKHYGKPVAFIVAAILVALISSGAVVYATLLADLPSVAAAASKVRPTSQILDRNGQLLYEVIDPNAGRQIDLDLDALPVACVQATLATEDSRFYLHPGFDPLAILRAAWQNLRADGAIVSGASTLTQQLVRILLFEESERYEPTLRRKIREAYLAWRLEQRYTKDELLALYINQSYYGNFAIGLEAAAQTFFAKPAAQLSRGECALLAGLVQSPIGYNPLVNPDAAKERQLTVLRLMRQAGYLSAGEQEQIAAEPLRFRSSLFKINAPHFVMYVQDLLVKELGPDALRRGGLRVYTSLDLNLQRRAEERIRYRLDLLNCRTPGLCTPSTNPGRRVDNAAVVVLDANGDILTLVGSPDYFDADIRGNVNTALALRQPGSAIKPLTYAAALDPQWATAAGVAPLTPASILADLPATFYVSDESGGRVPYQPVNYDRRYHGPVSVRAALANSYNIPAVKVLDRIGVDALRSIAAQAGISSLTQEYGLALTLGGGEVSLLELTSAFGIFLDGTRLTPRAVLDVQQRDPDGVWRSIPPYKSVGAGASRGEQVISPAAAYLITDILSDNTARIPAFGEGSVLKLPFPAAVKTGTTTDWRDNWTVGYSTERVVGVWVGNADNSPMLDVSGIDGAGPIWRDIMLEAHGGSNASPAPFMRPDDIVEVKVCAPSGMLPSPACTNTRYERFIRGTEPQQVDDLFQIIAVDRRTGMRADDDTPPEFITNNIYWNLPPEYTDWMIGQGIPLPPPSRQDVDRQITHNAPDGAAQPLTDTTDTDEPGLGVSLRLEEPTSQTAYQLHPGVPASSQRIRISGYAPDGGLWAELHLVKDGVTLAAQENAARISIWWTLEAGDHRFWLEGELTPGSPAVRSESSFVQVLPFAAPAAQLAQGP